MSNRRKFFILAGLVLVMLIAASALRQAASGRAWLDGDHVIVTEQYTLNQALDSALVAVADTVTLRADSRVAGDAALIGRSAVTLQGRVEGDLTAMTGNFRLSEGGQVAGDAILMSSTTTIDGVVNGDLALLGNTLSLGPGAHVSGEISTNATTITDQRAQQTPILPLEQGKHAASIAPLRQLSEGRWHPREMIAWGGSPSGLGLLLSVVGSLTLTGIAALAVTLFPRQFSHIQEAILNNPRSLSGAGCMTLLLMAGLGAVGVIALAMLPTLGLLLAPLGLLLGLALLAFGIAGWITLALILGDWVLRRWLRLSSPPLAAAVLGSLMLFAIYHVLAFIPYGTVVAFIVIVVLGSVGLGGALMTRLGTRPLRRSYFVQG
jgi:cytoskeletal protein CcmA (bactofilin family)